MDGRRQFATRALVGVILALMVSGGAAPAVAFAGVEPNGHASCMGLEQASISPPGTSDEEPGGAPQFVSEIKELAALLGVKPGTLFSFVAGLHAGSHSACDEALEG